MKTFTQDDLIRFLYNELNESEKTEINRAILENPEFAASYQLLQTAKEELDSAKKFDPSDSSIEIVLQHSRKEVKSESHS